MNAPFPTSGLAADIDLALAVHARGLAKRFGAVRDVDGIDLDVPRGMFFAILGPNGAGQTTLMRILAMLTAPDEGYATIMGHDLLAGPHEARGAISVPGPDGPARADDPLAVPAANWWALADLEPRLDLQAKCAENE